MHGLLGLVQGIFEGYMYYSTIIGPPDPED
jgi:hypothetical protein